MLEDYCGFWCDMLEDCCVIRSDMLEDYCDFWYDMLVDYCVIRSDMLEDYVISGLICQ